MKAIVQLAFGQKLEIIREARVLFGREVARMLWRKLELPPVSPPPPTLIDEARQCLRHLLDAAVLEGGPSVRQCLAEALDDDEQSRALLVAMGVRVMPDRDVFVIANRHPGLARVFAGTEWAAMAHARVLRRLPDAEACGPHRWNGVNMRGTLLPGAALDEG